jgi:hypothetical protein
MHPKHPSRLTFKKVPEWAFSIGSSIPLSLILNVSLGRFTELEVKLDRSIT